MMMPPLQKGRAIMVIEVPFFGDERVSPTYDSVPKDLGRAMIRIRDYSTP
jgi:hypothetical protein